MRVVLCAHAGQQQGATKQCGQWQRARSENISRKNSDIHFGNLPNNITGEASVCLVSVQENPFTKEASLLGKRKI